MAKRRICPYQRRKILEVTNSDLAVIGATVIDAKGMYIVPGFISMHAHGGAGYDFTEGSTEAFQKASLAHLKHGATSIFLHYLLPVLRISNRLSKLVKL